MRLAVFTWLDHEFIRLYAEGQPGLAVPEATRAEVLRRANGRCEYCLYPEARSAFAHQVDHIVSRKHSGTSALDNLALCCIFLIAPRAQILRRLILERERWFGSFIHGGIGGRITFVLWAGSSNRLHPKLPSQHACCASMKRSESWNVCFFKAWDSTRVNSSL